eukprot:gene11651-12850_t
MSACVTYPVINRDHGLRKIDEILVLAYSKACRITGTKVEPDAENSRGKYLLRKDCAFVTIVLLVQPKLLYLLGPDPEDPVAVGKKLADQLQKKMWAKKLTLRRKLHNWKLEDGQSVQKHVKTLTEIFDELSIIGDPVNENNQVVHLLASLPESQDMLLTALEASLRNQNLK